MANLQAMRRKIASVKNTQKITKAMKMVAASKLRRAQARILAFRPYALRIRQAVRDLSGRANRAVHPLLQKRPVRHIRVTVVSSDRGLCGAFNANIFRKALQVIGECEAAGAQVSVGVVGKKGGDYFRRRHWPVNDLFINIFHLLSFEHAMEIATTATQAYKNQEFDESGSSTTSINRPSSSAWSLKKCYPLNRWTNAVTTSMEPDTSTSQMRKNYWPRSFRSGRKSGSSASCWSRRRPKRRPA